MTPTCRTCGAKFPGKDTCNHCGSDPNATPTVASRVKRALGVTPSKPRTTKDRRARKAQVRSITNTKAGNKHGRQVKTRS